MLGWGVWRSFRERRAEATKAANAAKAAEAAEAAKVKIPDGDLKSLDLAYSESKEVFQMQLEQVDKLDAKTGVLLGAAGLILAVIVQSDLSETTALETALQFAAACLVALSAVFSLLALWVRKFGIPDPRGLVTGKLIKADPETTKKALLKKIVRDYEEARGKVIQKGRLTTAAAIILVIGLVFAVGGFGASKIGGSHSHAQPDEQPVGRLGPSPASEWIEWEL